MVQFTAGIAFPARFDTLDISVLIDGDITSKSSTLCVIDIGDGFVETFTGMGFVYDRFGDPAGGTITGITETYNGSTTFQITGLNTSVAQFVQWALSGDSTTALNTMLSGNDNVTGSNFDDYLVGLGGHDNLFGGAGADTVKGGDGNDHLYGQSANGGTDGADALYGQAGADYLQGNAGNDYLDGGDGSDRVLGGQGNDSIVGGAGNDTVNGNLGNDSVDGGDGNDSLRGGQGNDSIAGSAGNDILSGDLGVDTLTGGSGSDIFVVSGQSSTISAGPDRITDFLDGTDHIAVGFAPVAILAGATQSSLSAATSAAQQLFNGHAGNSEVAAIMVGSDTYLFYSSTGGATVDCAVQVVGVSANLFSTADFV